MITTKIESTIGPTVVPVPNSNFRRFNVSIPVTYNNTVISIVTLMSNKGYEGESVKVECENL